MSDVNDKHRDYRADEGIGLVFVRLYSRKTSDKKELRSFTRMLVNSQEGMLKRIGADFVAVHFVPLDIVVSIGQKYPKELPHLGLAVFGRVA